MIRCFSFKTMAALPVSHQTALDVAVFSPYLSDSCQAIRIFQTMYIIITKHQGFKARLKLFFIYLLFIFIIY